MFHLFNNEQRNYETKSILSNYLRNMLGRD